MDLIPERRDHREPSESTRVGFVARRATALKAATITEVRCRDNNPTKSLMKTRVQDARMAWIGGHVLDANKIILDKIKHVQEAAQTLEYICLWHTNCLLLALAPLIE